MDQREEGATSVEYAIVAALIGVVIALAVMALGRNLGATYDCSAEAIEALPASVNECNE